MKDVAIIPLFSFQSNILKNTIGHLNFQSNILIPELNNHGYLVKE